MALTSFAMYAVAIGGMIALGFAYVATLRRIVVQADEIYIVRDALRPFRRLLTSGTHLLGLGESIVKGDREPTYEFPTRDPHGQSCTGRLRDVKTGAITLKPQFCAPSFIALTQEPLHIRVDPLVQFKIDPRNIKAIVGLGPNFGLALASRIEQAFSVEFGKREDQRLKDELAVVRDAVLKALIELEAREPLGVEFLDLSFTFHQEKDPHRAHALRARGALAGPAIAMSESSQNDGVAFMEAAEYDVIMNLFDNAEHKLQVLLAILEMQTRRDIAEALAKSNQLVVVTAQELGLAGTAVQMDAMRNARPPLRSTPATQATGMIDGLAN